MADLNPQDVLQFWFESSTPAQWFKKDAAFDALIKTRFGKLLEQASVGDLDPWTKNIEGCLALILVLDQFSRNVHRDSPLAFSNDAKALSLSELCQERGYLNHPNMRWRHFMLIPMMHSEDLQVQEASLPLFREHTDERVYTFAVRHRDTIARFGRYPHRNAALGRESSAEEQAFLREPGSRF